MGVYGTEDAQAAAHAGRTAAPGVPPGQALGLGVGPYFLNHRELLGKLSQAAWETVAEMIDAATGECVRPGMVAVLQTARSDLGWSPHIHALVSRGEWTRDGRWVAVPLGSVRAQKGVGT